MNYELIDAITSIASVIISIVGFAFIIYQVRQINSTILSNTNHYVYTQTNEFIKFIVENNIREYFYENKEPDNVPKELEQKIMVACEMASCYFELVFLEKKNYHKGIFNNWKNYIGFVYKSSPVLRLYIENRSSWYAEDMIKYFKILDSEIENHLTDEKLTLKEIVKEEEIIMNTASNNA